MTDGISPSFGVPRDEPKENSYGEIIESKTIDTENQYSIGATPSFGVEILEWFNYRGYTYIAE